MKKTILSVALFMGLASPVLAVTDCEDKGIIEGRIDAQVKGAVYTTLTAPQVEFVKKWLAGMPQFKDPIPDSDGIVTAFVDGKQNMILIFFKSDCYVIAYYVPHEEFIKAMETI